MLLDSELSELALELRDELVEDNDDCELTDDVDDRDDCELTDDSELLLVDDRLL